MSETGHPNPYLRIDGTTWPDPSDPTDVQWRLRYGTPSKEDLLVAASVMNAYHALIAVPQRTRNLRVSQIRQALTTTKETIDQGCATPAICQHLLRHCNKQLTGCDGRIPSTQERVR